MAQILKPEERAAWGMLQRARPGIDWHKPSLRSADFVGDGTATRVMLGHDDDGMLLLGIVRAAREGLHNPAVFEITAQIGLAFEKIERREDWLRDGLFPLAGCRPKRGMQLLRVVATETGVESLYYWNAETRRIDLWNGVPRPRRTEPEAWEDLDTSG